MSIAVDGQLSSIHSLDWDSWSSPPEADMMTTGMVSAADLLQAAPMGEEEPDLCDYGTAAECPYGHACWYKHAGDPPAALGDGAEVMEHDMLTFPDEPAATLLQLQSIGQPQVGGPPATPQAAQASEKADVLEPTPEAMSGWTSVQQVLDWARLRGDPKHPPSLAGSLLRLMVDGDDIIEDKLLPQDIAQVSYVQFELHLADWKYSKVKAEDMGIKTLTSTSSRRPST